MSKNNNENNQTVADNKDNQVNYGGKESNKSA